MASDSLPITKEAYVDSSNPTTSYPGYAVVQVDTLGNIRRAVMEFDLANIIDVPIKNITSAQLRVQTLIATNVRLKDIRRIDTDSWVDTTVNWNNQPSSTDYNIEATWNSVGIHYVSILSILKDALRDGHDYMGILIRFIDESDDDTLHKSEWGSNERIEPTYDTYSQTALHNCLCKNRHFIDGFGEITLTDYNCPTPCDAATFTFKTAWGTTYTPVLLDVGDTVQYGSGVMHHSFKLDSMISYSPTCCDTLASATIEEKYWEDDCYVKTTGDNDRNGTSWTEAWSTVDQAANEAFDGQEVHIGFGTYSSEPASNDITPVNFGTTGIKYTPETAGTGGGTGTVTVERN